MVLRLFDRDNLCTRMQHYTAGTILPDSESIEKYGEGFERFTLLHEAGHMLLHSRVYSGTSYSGNSEPICCRKSGMEPQGMLRTQEQFREHQTSTFVAAMLMPEEIFREVALDYIHRMGSRYDYYLTPTLRKEDPDPCLDSLCKTLAAKFNVSRSAARIQLYKHRLVRSIWEK